MMLKRFGATVAIAAMLAGCGGDGGSGAVGTPAPIATPSPIATPTPTASTQCTLRARQDRVFAQLREWYLFPETLPASLDPTPFTSVQSYLDALTTTARNQGRDRGFTFITSIAEENAFANSGASAGFGVRLFFDANRLFIAEAFEGAPALAQGIDRGTEIVAIGTSEANLRTVSAIVAAEGSAGVSNALGPNTPGTARVLRVSDPTNGVRTLTVAKADFSLTPVSSRYGAKIINDGGRQVGYINLRTFSIDSADPALRQAFAQFRAANITNVIIDFRYNGGGFVRIADLMGDLLGRARSTSEVLDYTVFRPEKAAQENETRFFRTVPESIAPTKIAFIGTRASASASELVINAQIPYLRANAALIGTNTFGKPVGQIGLDTDACDDRLRVVAFQTQNASRQGEYYNGLAQFVEASCQAADDIARPLGDPQEASTRAALNFIAGVTCTRISSSEIGSQSARMAAPRRKLLAPEQPAVAQREVPGLY